MPFGTPAGGHPGAECGEVRSSRSVAASRSASSTSSRRRRRDRRAGLPGVGPIPRSRPGTLRPRLRRDRGVSIAVGPGPRTPRGALRSGGWPTAACRSVNKMMAPGRLPGDRGPSIKGQGAQQRESTHQGPDGRRHRGDRLVRRLQRIHTEPAGRCLGVFVSATWRAFVDPLPGAGLGPLFASPPPPRAAPGKPLTLSTLGDPLREYHLRVAIRARRRPHQSEAEEAEAARGDARDGCERREPLGHGSPEHFDGLRHGLLTYAFAPAAWVIAITTPASICGRRAR